MKKAFYGGTFNPPHLGHVRLGHAVLERRIAETVLFVPAWIPPHKEENGIASFEDRLEMLRIATRGERRFEISEIERERGGISYTIETLRLLSEQSRGDRFVLLLGSDSLEQLHTWHKAEELAEEFEILCYPRGGMAPVSLAALKRNWPAEIAEKLFSGILSGMPEFEVSSTWIREGIRNGTDVSGQMDHNILEYIKTRRLYSMEEMKNPEQPAAVQPRPSAKDLAEICAEIAYDRKAKDIIRLDMSEHSAVAEQFVICTGTSDPHLRAISERIRRDLRDKLGIRCEVDGTPESHWMIVDAGDVMVHVFTQEARELYQLESLWKDAPQTDAVKKLEARIIASRLRK